MSHRLHEVTSHYSPRAGINAMELVSNHSFPRHTHDEYGIGVVLSGAQRSWSGIGAVESLPGDVITVNPGELHDGLPVDGAARRWRIVYFEPAILAGEFMPEARHELEFVSPSLRHPSLGRSVNRMFDALADPVDWMAVEQPLLEIVARLVSSATFARDAHRATPAVARARARIDDDPSGAVTLSELAALCGVSRYQLVRAFTRELGITPHAYVVQCRVRLARQWLLRGETIAAAAHRAGFADQSHLTRAFVRQFGITPGRYLAARA
jgi:AraC-like DNA-binding protein